MDKTITNSESHLDVKLLEVAKVKMKWPQKHKEQENLLVIK